MKLFFLALCAILLGGSTALSVLNRNEDRLLGAKQCTWGPSYWCSNLTNAKGCHAVRHCIQTVWEKQTVPEDNDSVCQVCLDMVKQARDQLESNQTQEDLKSVFEGSCKLIYIKPVVKECMKLADDFVPELVEALASQMNPQVVCSVAGLCNNAAIDQMILEAEKLAPAETANATPPVQPQPTPVEIIDDGQLSCSECNHVASIISDKFHKTNRDDLVANMLSLCDRVSSYSDACANVILAYFNDIYSAMQNTLSADSLCHMSGVCSAKFHHHEGDNIEIRPRGKVGVVPISKDDIPCDLCKQLVHHLRDVLVANTTEAEFKLVLEGLCNQTGKFKSECIAIADEYYDAIYKELVNDLDADGACFLIGVCPKGVVQSIDGEAKPLLPFLPAIDPVKIEVSIKEKAPVKKLLGANEPKFTQDEILNMQLPIDHLVGAPNAFLLVENGELCTLCEYFLHFVQEALATPNNADKIKEVVGSTCNRLPKTIENECHNFVDMYGDAIIALLIQGIDPREVCPKLKMCPAGIFDMEVFSAKPLEVQIESGDKPSCPLCLLAVKQLQDVIKNDKSKDNIKHALDNLCSHLPKKLAGECTDFVDTYSAELVEMLITDFTPQQICVYLKLCTSTLNDDERGVQHVEESKDILTNEIQDETVNGQHYSMVDQEYSTSPQCLLCQHVIKDAEKDIVNKKSKEQIKEALEHVCKKMKAKIQHKCSSFVEKHGDQIVDLIMKEIEPKQICHILGLCAVPEAFDDLDIDEAISVSVVAVPVENMGMQSERMTDMDETVDVTAVRDSPICVVCEFVMAKIEADMNDTKTEEEIKHIVLNVCSKMPKTVKSQCDKFIEQYADLVIAILISVKPKEVCQKISLCQEMNYQITDEVLECGVCHGAVLAVRDIISEPDFDGDNDKLLDRGCNALPGQYFTKCADLLTFYGPSIVNLLRDNTEVSQICPTIGMCFKREASGFEFVKIKSQSRRQSRLKRDVLVGSNPCTYGPSYWCSSNANAEKCQSTSYCQEKVWQKNKL